MTHSHQPGSTLFDGAEAYEEYMTQQKYMRPGLPFAMGKAVEEAGEFLAAMGKTLRWGWNSYNPELPPNERETNADWVRREMADLRGALDNLEREMEDATRGMLDQLGPAECSDKNGDQT